MPHPADEIVATPSDWHVPTSYKLGWGAERPADDRHLDVILSFACANEGHLTLIVLPRGAAGQLAEDLLKLLGN